MKSSHLVRHTIERWLIVTVDSPDLEPPEQITKLARETPSSLWNKCSRVTCEPTCGKFILGEALNKAGEMVPAWGFDFGHDGFIVDPSYYDEGPAYFDLTQAEADELARLNAGRDLI
jgi:hypothetical protein